LRQYPELDGIPMRAIRRGFDDAIVAGLIRDGTVMFHPEEAEVSPVSTEGGGAGKASRRREREIVGDKGVAWTCSEGAFAMSMSMSLCQAGRAVCGRPRS